MSSRLETFDLFSKLPTELQLEVVAQTRPQPGVHFFSVHGGHQDHPSEQPPHSGLRIGEWSTRAEIEEVGFNGPHRVQVPFRFTLAAPSCNSAAPEILSWTDSNPSTYLADSGLMTASRLTRELMDMVHGWKRSRSKIADILEKHRGESDDLDDGVAKPLEDGQLSSEEASELDNAPTVATIKINGQEQDILLFPGRDLICLQPRTARGVMTLNFPMFSFSSISERRVTLGDGTIWGFQTPLGNVALEFDPSWARRGASNGGGPETIFQWFQRSLWALNIDGLQWIRRFWFIDYRIRRRQGASRLGHDVQQFHGNGCKFVEVKPDDKDWERLVDGDIFVNFMVYVDRRGLRHPRSKMGVLARVPPEA